MQIGSSQIELFSFPDPPARRAGPEPVGLRHRAFSATDLQAVVAHLENVGIAVESVCLDALTGRRFTFFKDPDGLPLELYEA